MAVNVTVDRPVRPREYLTEREIERLIKAAGENRWGRRDATAILIAYRHGLRASELVVLRWDDIDFQTGKLHVRRAKGGTASVHPIGGRVLRASCSVLPSQNEHEVGLIGPMSKADAADSDSTVRKHRQRGLIPWKPGQSGNPKGRPKGSRNKLCEEFFRDLCEAWQAFGKPALETMAMLYPVEFVRLVASLMPKEPEATITPVVMERMSDAQLDALIAQCIEGGLDPAATD